MSRLARLAPLWVAGCLSVPNERPPMCETTSDCDLANGEICADGVCWGDPPDGIYAARIGPPANRGGLVATEITKIDIADNGWFTTPLQLEPAVHVRGTVTLDCGGDACPAIASTIVISRPARIPGGVPFLATAHTTEDSADFDLAVPRAETDEDYTMVIAPDRANAQLVPLDGVPPARLIVHPTDDLDGVDVALGAHGRTYTGVVLDTTGYGLAGARVVIRGRWEADGGTTELSSVATTDLEGGFAVVLPESTTDTTAELEITPPDDADRLRPTLAVALDLATGAQLQTLATIEMPDLGTTHDLIVPVNGTSQDGAVDPVADADVRLVAELIVPRPPEDPIVARVDVRDTTDYRGQAQLRILDGPGLVYELRVKPPAASGAAFATIYGDVFQPTPGALQPEVHLATQVAVRGRLYDHDGRPAEGVVVTAVPNAAYAATLDEALQDRLSEVVSTSETTESNGEFAVYVDPEIDGLDAQYDVLFEAPAAALLPSWQAQAVTVERATGYDMGDIDLPEAAYVRSPVLGPDEEPVADAEVRLYEIPSSILPCLTNPGPSDPTCAQKAILRAHATSDDTGEVRLVLPDP